MNRESRHAKTVGDRERLTGEYSEQKLKVQRLVKDKITEHERRITTEIRESRDKGRKMWEHIRKLKEQETKSSKSLQLFNEQGKQLNKTEAEMALTDFWEKIYQRHRNTISEVWTVAARDQYNIELSESDESVSIGILEHLEMCLKIKREIKAM